jgi:hypothetical protein
MKLIRPKYEEETYEEQLAARRYHPATVLLWGDLRLTLSCGTSDYVQCFIDETTIYVVSINNGLGYAALQTFYAKGEHAGEENGSVFCSDSQDIHEMLGPRGIDYSMHTIAKRLAEYIY